MTPTGVLNCAAVQPSIFEQTRLTAPAFEAVLLKRFVEGAEDGDIRVYGQSTTTNITHPL